MRVALISYYYPEYTISLASALAARQVEILLMLPSQEARPYAQALAADIAFRPFWGRRLRDPLSALEARKIVETVRVWGADVVHLQQGHLWFNVTGLPLLGDMPLVTTVHDVASHPGDAYTRRTPQWVWDLPVKRSSQLIVHGESLKAQLAKRHGVTASRIHVIPHGEFSLFAQWDRPHQAVQKEVLFFGRIWPYKGLQYLIQAEPLITAQVPTARIVIAGEGENLDPYEQMMVNKEHYEIHNRFIPPEQVSSFFQRATLVVLPYVEASQSGIIPLAYAFGKPVVATSVGGIPEVVDHGETGYLVPPRDVPKLAEAVVDLLRNDALRERMGQRAYVKATTDLSWEGISARTVQVYEAAVDS